MYRPAGAAASRAFGGPVAVPGNRRVCGYPGGMRIPFLSRPHTPVGNRRRQRRLEPRGDSYARIDGRDHPIRNWSEDGLLVAPYAGGLVAGQRATLSVVISYWHDPHGVLRLDGLAVTVLRLDRYGLAVRFRRLERYKAAALKLHYDRKHRSPT